MTVDTRNRILDALDDAPRGRIHREFIDELATIAWLSRRTGFSATTIRRTVHQLHNDGLVRLWLVLDARSRRNRLFVTGVAV